MLYDMDKKQMSNIEDVWWHVLLLKKFTKQRNNTVENKKGLNRHEETREVSEDLARVTRRVGSGMKEGPGTPSCPFSALPLPQAASLDQV